MLEARILRVIFKAVDNCFAASLVSPSKVNLIDIVFIVACPILSLSLSCFNLENLILFYFPSNVTLQVFQPWIQRRRLAYAKHKHVIAGILQRLRMRALGRLCKDDGTINEEVLKKYVMLLQLVFSYSTIPSHSYTF